MTGQPAGSCANYGARFTCQEADQSVPTASLIQGLPGSLAAYERKEKPCQLFVKWRGFP